ncbi:MAG: hypothetical protein WCJ70_01125 [bacterium]
MRRYILIATLLFSLCVSGVYAQTNHYYKVTPEGTTTGTVRIAAAQSELAACVHANWCNTAEAGCTLATSRRVKLQNAFQTPISSVPTYVIMCTGTGTGQICTSGDPVADMKIYGRDNSAGRGATLTNASGVRVSNPLPAGTSIEGIEWEDNSGPGSVRRFSFINYFDQAITQKNTDSSSPKIGSQVFTASANCRSISWPVPPGSDPPRTGCSDPTANGCTDPYGIIFDNATLEPVAGARVTLYRERDDKKFTLYEPCEKTGCNLTNPQTVGADGLYNLVVPAGTYRMEVSPPIMTDQAKLNTVARRVYSDIYHGDSFVEAGVIVHLDIPVTADQSAMKAQQSKLMTYSYTIDRPTSSILFEGRASHPLTTVESYTYLTSNTTPNPLPVREVSIDTQQADTGGVFTIKLPLASIPTSESFGLLKLTKKNIADLASSGRKTGLTTVSAEDVSYITLNPIPEKIEGYLTDKSGTPLKNMRVDILLPYADTPYLSTTTDSTGFLQIPGSYLPSEPFVLSSPTTSTTWTTSEFLAGNTRFYEQDPRELTRPLTIVGDGHVATEELSQKEQVQMREQIESSQSKLPQKVPQRDGDSVTTTLMLVRYIIITILLIILLMGVMLHTMRARRRE